jgi:hypothetical protein
VFLFNLKRHSWFAGIDWDNIRNGVAPYVPEVSSPTDTSNFDVDDNDIRQSDAIPPTTNAIFTALHLPFVGFTFTQFRYIIFVNLSLSSPKLLSLFWNEDGSRDLNAD